MKRPLYKRLTMRAFLVLFVFFIMLVSMVVTGLVTFFLVQVLGLPLFETASALPALAGMLLSSTIIGTMMTVGASKRTIKPLRQIIEATHRVAAGDFSVHLEVESVPEVEDLANSFNGMVAELSSIETLRSDFISDFSHEFRTPIVSIRGFAKRLRKQDLPEEERAEAIDIIIQESERLVSLSSSVLDLTRLENTGILSGQNYFFLDEQLRKTAALLAPRWEEKNLTVHLELASITFYGSEDLLERAWINLLDNAVKFTPPGGRIGLTLQRREDTALFTLTDTGPGMDEATLNHLYDKFYQGETSRTGAGSGLGLSMVKQIVTLSGGTITAQSVPGQGSTFTVALPLQKGPAGGP